jgi:hypothetical protein
MRKFFLSWAIMLIGIICYGQTMICWREDVTIRNPKTGLFEPISKTEMNSEAFFGSDFIRINDAKIYLRKTKLLSEEKSENGIVKVYGVVNNEGVNLVAVTVEDKSGIFKLMINNPKYEAGVVYYIKNR